ncbi:shikimate dehydrogenase [Lichenifustis flavocetrariae]|uniref:Shikimate dehydrogenase (NADP(+)) n=1 Tax=Lichenifustis flavocetrariae TaxID=2949735 RepID=A0AA41YVZ3_9HYPH|nr:shikimate dehydrogenase [Lichenifustis flavocetrariae]MCW6508231.1 shikimate dehydrogenase [Lichenifustis flavocetrariae]
MTATPRAFVIGQPITHSRSPLLHGHWLETLGLPGSYERVEVAPERLAEFVSGLRQAGFVGGNVTVPHKTGVLALVDELDDAARTIGAVNTLWFEGDRLWGGNTDAIGFLSALDQEAPGWDEEARVATVIGAGGAARAIVYGLLQRGLDVWLVNRSRGTAEALSQSFARLPSVHDLDALPGLLSDTDLLVNTTALGMTGKPPLVLDLAGLKPGSTVCDIVYAPLETDLLRQARAGCHPAVGGLGMLMHQAVPGFARWFGRVPEVTPALRATLEADLARR